MVRPRNPLVWQHFREMDNKSVTCRHCEKQYRVASLQKMGRHLLQCINCPENCKQQLRTSSIPYLNNVVLPLVNTETVMPTVLQVSDEPSSFSSSARRSEDLHKLLAKAIYVSGSPLSMVEHPLWINFFDNLQPLYKLPTRKTISTSILDKTYNEMQRELKDDIISKPCLHLQLDGWSNCRREGIINVLISKPEPVFVKSIATEENRHTSEYMSDIISNVLLEHGPNKFQTVIGDNASNVQRAFRLVKEVYPHITGLNCVAHTLHLLCKNIIRMEVINVCREMATSVIKAIKKSQVLTSLLGKIVKEKKVGETLKLACETRWGSYCTSFKSLENTKIALQTLAVHEQATLLPSEEKAALLNDGFWVMVKQCIQMLEPVSDAILKLESNKENIHTVYITLKDMKSKILFILPELTIIESHIKDTIVEMMDERIKMCLKPIHYAAYLLDPAGLGAELNETEEGDAIDYISQVGNNIGLTVMPNLASYRAKDGFWMRRCLWENLAEIKPTTWWNGLCRAMPLSKVAGRILSAPCTSAAAERSFSAQSFIHNKKRNRLTTDKAAKITFIAYNWNILNKNQTENTDYCECPDIVEQITSSNHLQLTTSSDHEQPSTSTNNHNIEFFDCGQIISDSDSD